jgi:hypothetical protein
MTQAHPRPEITLDQQVATRPPRPDTSALSAEVTSEHRARSAGHAATEAAS